MFDKCGIFGASADPKKSNIAWDIFKGGVANNHRGYEGFGIVAKCQKQNKPFVYHGDGRVKRFIDDLRDFENLNPYLGMIHNRYSTSTTDSLLVDNHPIKLDTQNIVLDKTSDVDLNQGAYIVHNGDVSFYLSGELKKLIHEKFKLTSKTDTAVLGQLYMLLLHLDSDNDPIAAGSKLMKCIPESYSVMILYGDDLIVMRDPYGKKPLSLGFGKNVMYASSENRAFRAHGIAVDKHFSVKPCGIYHLKNGVIADSRERNQAAFNQGVSRHFCMFEDVYTARFDTILKKNTAYYVREERGKILGRELRPILRERGIIPDVACQVPVSAEPYTVGLSYSLRVPYDDLLVKIAGRRPPTAEVGNINSYDRGYLKKTTTARRIFTERSYMINPDRGPKFQDLKGKTVVLVDDSVVRGNTLFKPVEILRKAGVKTVVVAVGSPPLINTCWGGNDFDQDQLAGWDQENKRFRTVDEINKKFVKADLLYYISRNGLIEASDYGKDEVCTNCWKKEIWKPKADLRPLIRALKEF